LRRNPDATQTYELTFVGQAAVALRTELDDCAITSGSGKGGEMKRSGRPPSRPSQAVPPAGGNGPTRQSKAAEVETRAVLLLVGAAVLLRLLQSRRFWERLAVSAIVLGALGRIGQENGAGMMERLAAWDKRQAERLECQAGHLQRQAERQGRRLVRKAKGPWPRNA
jgi:hypothetical protein